MPKTAAQRAARRRRKAAKKARVMAPKRGPIFRNPQPVPKKRAKRQANKLSNPVGPNSMRVQGYAGAGTSVVAGRSTSMATNRRTQVIEEDEFIAPIYGSVSFNTTKFAINPGQAGSFPWGNKIAQLYERYDFEMLEFYTTSTVSGFATNGQQGTVVLSIDYDASDLAPVSMQQVEDTDPHTVPALPSTSVIALRADCNEIRSSDAKYVRPGALPANTDIKTYDAGNLYVSTEGCSNTTKIGELHVRYRCRFTKPVLEAGTLFGPSYLHVSSNGTGTAADPCDGMAVTFAYGCSVGPISSTGFTVSDLTIGKNYLLMMTVSDLAVALTLATLGQSTGTGWNILVNDTTYSAAVTNPGSNQAAIIEFVTATSTSNAITIGLTDGIACSVDFILLEVPNGFGALEQKSELDEMRDEIREMRSFIKTLLPPVRGPTAAKPASAVLDLSEPSTPDECKEADLEKSVHIPKSMAARLSRVLIGK